MLFRSTHNESRLAACPLSGVPGARSRSLSTNTQASWEMCTLVWPDWTGLSSKLAGERQKRLETLQPECLKGPSLRVTIEDRVNPLHYVGTHVEEVALVLNWDQRLAGSVVHRDLKRLCQ